MLQIYETVGFGEVERNCIVAMPQTLDPELLNTIFNYGIRDVKLFTYVNGSLCSMGSLVSMRGFRDRCA